MKIKGLIFLVFALIYSVNLSAQILKGSSTLFFEQKAHMDAFSPNLPYGAELAFVLEDSTLYRWSRDMSEWAAYTSNKVYVISSAADTSTISTPRMNDIAYVDSTLMFLRDSAAWLLFSGRGGATADEETILGDGSGTPYQVNTDSLHANVGMLAINSPLFLPPCETSDNYIFSGVIIDDSIRVGHDISSLLDETAHAQLAVTYIQEQDGYAFFEISGTMTAGSWFPTIEYRGETLVQTQVAIEASPCYTDTIAAERHDTSAVFHKRLTFGASYTLPAAVLDTADLISIYAGAQLGSPVTITLPTLSDTTNDGKIIYVMGSAAESGEVMRITSPDSTDILVQGCGAGSVTGPDTIKTSYRVLYPYIISNGRYYRTCQRPNVNSITSVPDTTITVAHQGDMFVNSTSDTLGLYSGTGWVLFYGGGESWGILTSQSGSLSAALAAVSATKKTIIVDDSQVLTGNLTIPDSITLFFADHGLIDLAGNTLTLNGDIEAGLQQIFSENLGAINGRPKKTTWYAEWFGAKVAANSATNAETANDDHDAIQAALNAIKNTGGGELIFQAGHYHNLATLYVPDNSKIIGAGMDNTHIWAANDSSSVDLVTHAHSTFSAKRFAHFYLGTAHFTDAAENVTISDLSIHGFDSFIGLSAKGNTILGINSEPTNETTGATDALKDVYIERVGMYDFTAAVVLAGRAYGHENPSDSGFGFNTNINVINCRIDSTTNKAIEYQEVNGGVISGNYLDHVEDGIQAIHYCRNVKIANNHIIVGNGYNGDLGIALANDNRDIIISGNTVQLINCDPVGRNSQSAPFNIKFDNNSTVTGITPYPADTISNIIIQNNVFDATLAGLPETGVDAFNTASKRSDSVIRNLFFSGNTWAGGAIRFSDNLLIGGDNVVGAKRNGIVFSHDKIGDIQCDTVDIVYDITFRNCEIDGPDETSTSDTISIRAQDWLFQGNNIDAFLRFQSSSSGNVLIGNVGIDTILAGGGGNVDTANFNLFLGVAVTAEERTSVISFRKVISGYSGNAFEVTRASDSTSQNIAFSSSFADTTALKSFCAGTDCYLTRWYDQTENDNYTAEDTATAPVVVQGGNIRYKDGHPVVYFDGTNDRLSTSARVLTDPFSVFVVASNPTDPTASPSGRIMAQNDVSADKVLFYGNRSWTTSPFSLGLQVGTGTALGGSSSDTLLHLYAYLRSSTALNGWYDNSQLITGGTVGSGTAQNYPLRLGNRAETSDFFEVEIAEIIIYDGGYKTSEESTIRSEINTHYSIY